MSKSNNRGKHPNNNSANHVPPLKAANPIKLEELDWWDEMCKAHGAKNYWPKKKKGKKSK